MDVYSLRFYGCNTVYPHTIVRPVEKYKLESRPYLQKFIDDLSNELITIKNFVGDNPKRADAKEVLCHSSLHACEYCFVKATSHVICDKHTRQKKTQIETQLTILEQKLSTLIGETNANNEEELKNLNSIKTCLETSLKDLNKKKTQVVWPSSTMNGEPRTTEAVRQIVEQIEENPDLPRDERKGIVGRSPLLALEYFDFVRDSTCEYLHSVCLGVVKRLVELTFQVGITRIRITKRKLTPISVFNELISNVKVVCEFSRRVRSLDYSVWKGQEFRNLVLFYVPIVIDCIEENAPERKLWLLLCYVMRLCVLPENEFRGADSQNVSPYCAQFYKLYEKIFGVRNCTYNTHTVFSHLIEIRAHGPLTSTSAFGFEHFYDELRNSFAPGTTAPLKQIMEKILLKRSLDHHSCQTPLVFKAHETSLECNNLIYTYRNQMYQFYKIMEIDGEKLHCVTIKTKEIEYPSAPMLNWRLVGHFEIDEITNEKQTVEKVFAGKVIRVKDTLMTCPTNVLQEK